MMRTIVSRLLHSAEELPIRIVAIGILSILVSELATADTVVLRNPVVRIEEEVYTLKNPDNGSGPLWSYGCTQIARMGGQVVVSAMETGVDVPPLCNTRWRLLRREQGAWRVIAEADAYRQREPCPVAITSEQDLFLYVNDSLEPPGTHYGPCEPHLIHFRMQESGMERAALRPQWAGKPYYTDHSYRGYAADPARGELLMLNIDAKTGVQHACLLNITGDTLATGSIEFPIRSCYPQVALVDRAAYVLAIGDIVEPVKEWREYKFEQTQRQWDYVFRILYFTWTPDITSQSFAAPIEIANVDATGGHISNQDLWIAPDGAAWIMYTEREVQYPSMRDRFFPGRSVINSLYLAVVKNGAIIERRVLIEGSALEWPGHARFHPTPDGQLYVVAYCSSGNAGNRLLRLLPENDTPQAIPIPLKRPMGSYCLASVRAGNTPSFTIDMLGLGGGNTLSYARIDLEPAP